MSIRHKLLVVDDSNLIRLRITRVLMDSRDSSWNIVGLAPNGVEAVKFCKNLQPTVATLDITMPEMDGVTCVTELLKVDPKLRILIVSALSDKATALQALKRGAHGFLYKPFTDLELLTALREVVEDE
jgi:two-component system, chemotaxis family, chemotaxis protein CheY